MNFDCLAQLAERCPEETEVPGSMPGAVTMKDDLLVFAKNFAIAAHGSQKRWNGEPYSNHPIRVSQMVERNSGTIEMQVAALLHDVVEDCNVSLEYIQEVYGLEVKDLVDALSRREHETYKEFLQRTMKSQDASLIKRCDILDNLSTMPLGNPLSIRYTIALQKLLAFPKED